MENNTYEPEWFDEKISYGRCSTYRQIFDKFAVCAMTISTGYDSDETTGDILATFHNKVTSPEQYKLDDVVRDGVKYGWEDQEIQSRIKSGKKLLKKQSKLVSDKNHEIDRATWKKVGELLAHDIESSYKDKKPSMFTILRDLRVAAAKALATCNNSIESIINPVILQKTNIKWFAKRDLADYWAVDTEKTHLEKLVDDLDTILSLFYPIACRSLLCEGRSYEYSFPADNRHDSRTANRAKSMLKTCGINEESTYWDLIKAILRTVGTWMDEHQRKYEEKLRSSVNSQFNVSTNGISNFFDSMDDVAESYAQGGVIWLLNLCNSDVYGLKNNCSLGKVELSKGLMKWRRGINLQELYNKEEEEVA